MLEQTLSTDEIQAHAQHVLLVRAGDEESLNAVLATVMATAAGAWAFTRGADERGTHVRLALGGDGLPGALRGLASAAERVPDRNFWAVEECAPIATDAVGGLHEEACLAILAALTEFQGRQDRLAWTLAALKVLEEARGEPIPWTAAAWEDADPVLPELPTIAASGGPALSALGSTYRGLQADDAIWLEHARLLCNRAGNSPAEAAWLAHCASRDGDESLNDPQGVDLPVPAVAAPPVVRLALTGSADDQSRTAINIHAGETFGILGANGAYRTHLVDLIAGLRTTTSETVEVLGLDPRRERPALRGRLVKAHDVLSDELTVRANFELWGDNAPAGRIDQLLINTRLGEFAGRPARDLDVGQRRRTSIACALVGDPEILVLEDPSRDLSALDREQIWALVEDRRRRARTTLIATESAQDVLELCDRAVLAAGECIGDPALARDLVQDLFSPGWLHLSLEREPDLELLTDLPDVLEAEVEPRPGYWIVRLQTLQPEALSTLLAMDPDFPQFISAESHGPPSPLTTSAVETKSCVEDAPGEAARPQTENQSTAERLSLLLRQL